MTPRPRTPRGGSLTPRPYKTAHRLTAFQIPASPLAKPDNVMTAIPRPALHEDDRDNQEQEPQVAPAAEDSRYEFNAPQFHDFLNEKSETGIDSWFDICQPSPTVSTVHDFDGRDNLAFNSDEEDVDYPVHDTCLTPKAIHQPTSISIGTAAAVGRGLGGPPARVSIAAQLRQAQEEKEQEEKEEEKTPKAVKTTTPTEVVAATVVTSGTEVTRDSEVPKKDTDAGGDIWTRLSKPVDKQRRETVSVDPRRKSAVVAPKVQPVGPTGPRPSHVAPQIKGPRPSHIAPQNNGPRPLTVPKEFSFATRFKAKHEPSLAVRSPGIKKKKKPVMKRIGGLTIPKPFNFHSTLRSIANDVSAPKSPFVPLAVKVKTFETQVPDRFRGTKNKMRNSVVPQSMPTSPWAGRVRMTRPRSPYLLTKMRTKTHHVPSHEETELAELAKIQPFKAKPVDRHILHSEPILPAVPRAPITVPESPHITKPRPAPARPPSPPRIPHARPVPTKVFEAPFEPQIHHRVITPVEYELPGDQISRKKKLEFEQRRREEEAREREQKQFHAQPLPFDDVPSQRQPHIEPRPITQPLPFTLETEVRGLFSQLALSSKLEREEAEDQERKKFKAQPIPLALDHPFFPAASNKPLTSTDPDFILNTDARAEERRAFDERRREREREEERVRERMRKEQEEREAEEIRQLRAAQVHRAQPPQYATRMKPVTIHPSNRKLTDPASPFIGTKRRTADQIKIDPFGAVKPKLGAETLSATSVAVAQQHPRQQFQFQVPQQPQQPQQQPQQQQTSPTTTTTTTTTTTHHHRLHPHPSYQRSPFDSPADAGSDHAEDHHHELGEHFRYKGGGGAELQKRLYEVAERIERGERVDE